MKIKWTLSKKIQLTIIVVLLFVFIITQFVMSQFISQQILRDSNSKAINTAALLQKNLEIVFNDAHDSLNFLNTYHLDEVRNDDVIREDLRQLTVIKDTIKNAFVIYSDGSFVLEPFVKIPESFDPRQRDYYKSAYNSRTIFWSDPYIDQASQDLVITSAIYIQFENIDGVIGVDLNLSEIPEVLSSTKVGISGFSLIVSENDIIIADSEKKYVNQNISVLEDEELFNSNLISGVAETSKGKYFIRRLYETNMRLVSFLPEEDISSRIRETNQMLSMVLVTAFLISTSLTHLFSRKMMNPIRQLKETMKASEASDTLFLLDLETTDELNTLIQGYNNLAQHVNVQNEAMLALSKDLRLSEQELQKQYERVSELAYNDYLTGLPNRVKFEEQAKMMINNKEAFSLFYMDLDDFKYINDTYGHSYGDIVLQILSKRLKNCCKGKHFGARLSGDEFGVLVKETEESALEAVAMQMLKLANEPIKYRELEFTVTATIGISIYPEDGRHFEDLLSNADIAMYEAKNKNKNNYLIFSKELRQKMIDQVTLESQLVNALAAEEFYLCYQPLIEFETKAVYGFEALARWENETLGFVSPSIFIPMLEKSMMINDLGYFVLEESIKFGRELYQETGLYYEMNVNVSLIQLHLEDFVEVVVFLLDKYNFPSEHLNLELTESVALESSVKIKEKLEKLRILGVSLSLDDFGTGYSSLNHLLNIDITHLKIDREIILKASKDKAVYQLIHGIVEFSHGIGLKVIAEGIEDRYMESLMQKMTIDFAQGYLYSKPIKANEVFNYLSQKS